MIGELLDILEADDAAVVSRDGGKARRSLVNVKRADCLEGDACPAGLEGPGAHFVVTGNHGGRKEERVFQRDTAELRTQALLIFRLGNLKLRPDILIEPCY